MVERYKRQPTCSDESWHELWRQFNKSRPDNSQEFTQVSVDRASLMEVVDCAGRIPQDLIMPRPSRGISALVDRAKLFDFLKHHGETCGVRGC